MLAAISLLTCSRYASGIPSLSYSGVSIGPGLTALTRMPRPSNSVESVFDMFKNAAFVAAYTDERAAPACALTEVLSTTEAGFAKIGSSADRKSTRLNSSHLVISYAVFCLKKKKVQQQRTAC